MKIAIKPLSRFVLQKPNSGILLFLATVVAIILANSDFGDAYYEFLAYPINLQLGNFGFFAHHGTPMSLLSFVNDALMAVFFFVVGLEIKQELLVGELSSVRKALLPVIAACGGMIVPVLVYFVVCHTGAATKGVAIPMATDIAFALAVLGSLGKRVPLPLRIFLTALAVVDDIGGIIVIALFYSSNISFLSLIIAAIILFVLYIGGRMHVNKNWFYYIGGFFVWMFFLESGIHPSIAGVVVAFTVPARPIVNLDNFAEEMKANLELLDFAQAKRSSKATVLSAGQVQILNNIHNIADKTISPLQCIIDKLNPFVNYFILPLFAFVNAGVRFEGFQISALAGIPLAIFLGLFVGKTVGIFTFSYFFSKTGIVTLPRGINKRMLFGVSILGGIGFTVSLFIANLSFISLPEIGGVLLNEAKIGIFAGSLVSGFVGFLFLKKVLPKKVINI